MRIELAPLDEEAAAGFGERRSRREEEVEDAAALVTFEMAVVGGVGVEPHLAVLNRNLLGRADVAQGLERLIDRRAREAG